MSQPVNQSPKRIAVVLTGYIPSHHVRSINTVRHAEAFARLGHWVEVFAPLTRREDRFLRGIDSPQAFYGVDGSISFNLIPHNRLYYHASHPLGRLIVGLGKRLTGYRLSYVCDAEQRIARTIRDGRFDLAYCRARRVPWYLIQMGIPTVVEMHSTDVTPEVTRLLSRGSDPAFRALSTIAPSLADQYAALGVPREKILVQEDAVDTERFAAVTQDRQTLRTQLGWPLDLPLVVYCGGIYPGKAIADLLVLAQQLHRRATAEGTTVPRVLVVGGPDANRLSFQAEAQRRGVTNVDFLPAVPHPRVPHVLKAADALVMLYNLAESQSVMDRGTTSPVKLFEYMASGTPFVCSALPTIEKIVTHGTHALLPTPGDHAATADAVWTLLHDRTRAATLAAAAQQRAADFTYIKRVSTILGAAH